MNLGLEYNKIDIFGIVVLLPGVVLYYLSRVEPEMAVLETPGLTIMFIGILLLVTAERRRRRDS